MKLLESKNTGKMGNISTTEANWRREAWSARGHEAKASWKSDKERNRKKKACWKASTSSARASFFQSAPSKIVHKESFEGVSKTFLTS